MARSLRVRVDHQRCVGNAMCEALAPAVFRLNANRQSEAINPAGDTEEKILEAAENCRSARSSSRMPRQEPACSPSARGSAGCAFPRSVASVLDGGQELGHELVE
jgi:ferredoxin